MNPSLRIHTHWQVAQSSRTSQNLPKSMAAQPHGRKESTGIQHCIKAIAGEVVNSRYVHLINHCGVGQVIALKSATALILDRYKPLKRNLNEQKLTIRNIYNNLLNL